MHCITHLENEVYVDILYCVLQHCRYLDILQWQGAAWCRAVRQLEHGNIAAHSLIQLSLYSTVYIYNGQQCVQNYGYRYISRYVKRSIYPANRCYVRYDLIFISDVT